ncbi:MAG: hypothetical protein ACRD0H_08005, partial [Actinomycetes bacterium]
MPGVARSPLYLAEDTFRTLCTQPHPLAFALTDLNTALRHHTRPDHPGSGGQPPAGQEREAVGEVWAGLETFTDPRTGAEVVAADVLRRWIRRPATANPAKNAVWTVLVRRAQTRGGAATVAAVALALPRLVRLACELAEGDGPARVDIDAELLIGYLHTLARLDPDEAALFPKLLRGARAGGIRWLRQQRGNDTALHEAHPTSQPPPPAWAHTDLVLAEAIRSRVLTAAEADLICTTRLDKVSLVALAARLDTTPDALRKRRHRAETRLVTALREAMTDHDTHDPSYTAAALHLPPATAPSRRRRGPVQTTPAPSYRRGHPLLSTTSSASTTAPTPGPVSGPPSAPLTAPLSAPT